MSREIQIFIEYNIKSSVHYEYEKLMQNVIPMLSEFGAEKIEWYLASKQRYIEIFRVPTEAHFYALKKLRTSKHHTIFKNFDELVEGGSETIKYWALRNVSAI